MFKKFLSILLLTVVAVAIFSVVTASPASAASRHSVAVAAKMAPTNVKKASDANTICYYRVTATAGLNARSGAGLKYAVQYTLPYNDIVDAYAGITSSADGYTWRELGDGNWAVTNWLPKVPSYRCVD